MHKRDIDIAVIGGGLAGGLIALALAKLRPELRVTIVEGGTCFGGNHVWSSFASEIAAENEWLVEPLVTARWDGYGLTPDEVTRKVDGNDLPNGLIVRNESVAADYCLRS